MLLYLDQAVSTILIESESGKIQRLSNRPLPWLLKDTIRTKNYATSNITPPARLLDKTKESRPAGLSECVCLVTLATGRAALYKHIAVCVHTRTNKIIGVITG